MCDEGDEALVASGLYLFKAPVTTCNWRCWMLAAKRRYKWQIICAKTTMPVSMHCPFLFGTRYLDLTAANAITHTFADKIMNVYGCPEMFWKSKRYMLSCTCIGAGINILLKGKTKEAYKINTWNSWRPILIFWAPLIHRHRSLYGFNVFQSWGMGGCVYCFQKLPTCSL